LPASQAELYSPAHTGQTASERLALLRQELNKLGADTLFVTPLEETAWTLLLRGRDVAYTPVLVSYLLIETDSATLFVQPNKVSQEVQAALAAEGITTRPYEEAFPALAALTGRRVLLPETKTSWAAFEAVHKDNNTILTAPSPLSWMKAVRTQTERDGLRQCMVRDGVAMVKFQKWLTETVAANKKVTEVSLAAKLRDFRAEQDLFQGESFATIAGYGANAASPHYCATSETDTELQRRGYLLLDSGGQYLDGTTDITRTITLGSLTEDEKIDYTLVLRGHINLAMAKFPKGTNGNHLDALARLPMWERGMQYLHGTGHGVGHYLSVHEATDLYQFRMSGASAPLMLHTTITNEPALYKAGSHGCRTENQLLIVPDQTTEFGEFYRFETLTLVPIDREPIIASLMRPHEIRWLNTYHERVFAKLSPHLTEPEREWLRDRCQAI
jgi:Xaa-Pro aminopeptidase